MKRVHGLANWIAWVQGGYYLLTGIWPIVHMESFLAVTGPKVDLWLVVTVGVLVGAVGLGLLVAAWAGRGMAAEIIVIALAAAVGLIGIDVVYVAIGRIGPIYLMDAAAQLVLVAAWIVAIVMHPASDDGRKLTAGT